MYWLEDITFNLRTLRARRYKIKNNYGVYLVIFLSILTTLLQSFGGFFPGLGYLISPFATIPITIAVLISVNYGILVYFNTIFLLLLIQSSEIIIFTFSTGLLGIAIGISIKMIRYRIGIIIFSALFLMTGLIIVLFIFNFPILGEYMSTDNYNFIKGISLFMFSLFYSWLWLELTLSIFKKLRI